jgi:hypothetical protein
MLKKRSGIRWNTQYRNLLPSPPRNYSCGLFIRQTLTRVLAMYLGYNTCTTIALFLVSTSPFFAQPVTRQVAYAWTEAFRAYYFLELGYYLLAILSNFLRISQPHEWAALTGSFRKDAWSVSNMWGKCWHQMARRQCSEAGRIVKEVLRLRSGGIVSRYRRIWVGFAVSALTHHAGAVMGGFEDGGYWQVVYFMVQPVAIMLGDLAMGAGKRIGAQESGGLICRPCETSANVARPEEET